VSDAVFVFDGRGRRCAASPGSDAGFDHPVRSIDDLVAKFRSPDGTALALDVAGSHLGVGLNGMSGYRVAITAERVEADSENADDSCPMTIVTVRAFSDEDDPSTLRFALGSILAHELRTPMTTIFGGAQLMEKSTVSDSARTQAAASVRREAMHLNRIVEDLVTLVRGDRDRADDPEPLMVQHVLARIVDEQRAAHPDAMLKLTVLHTVPAVLATQAELEHALRNLIDHALTYGPLGDAVRIEARRAGDEVEISIADDGPARDDVTALSAFDLFHVSSRTAADPSGANLALVVSRRLVRGMGGRIWARSTPTGGEIVFALPVASANDA
jgi:signal transduction histidine kinase